MTNHHQPSCILVLLGLPGSGKTTLARKLTTFLSEGHRNVSVNCVSYDDLVPLQVQAEIARATSDQTTKSCRSSMKDSVESFLCSVKESPCVVIVDDNNYYRSMRYEYYQLAAKHRVGYMQLYLDCSLEEAEFNNALRPEENRVPVHVISPMKYKFQVPSEVWENCLVISNSNSNNPDVLQLIWSRIQESFKSPIMFLQMLEEKEALSMQSRISNDRSILHGIDAILRKQVGQLVLAEKDAESKSDLARRLNNLRLSIMEDVKSGVVNIPEEVASNRALLEEWSYSLFHSRINSV